MHRLNSRSPCLLPRILHLVSIHTVHHDLFRYDTKVLTARDVTTTRKVEPLVARRKIREGGVCPKVGNHISDYQRIGECPLCSLTVRLIL